MPTSERSSLTGDYLFYVPEAATRVVVSPIKETIRRIERQPARP